MCKLSHYQSRPSEVREALVAYLTDLTFFVAYSSPYGWLEGTFYPMGALGEWA